MGSTSLRAVAFAWAALVPLAGLGAELTRLASSFEDNDPFGMIVKVGYDRTRHRAKLLREVHQDNTVVDAYELFHEAIDERLTIDARIGLWQDLELRYAVPVVFRQNNFWRYGLTNSADSTISQNCLQADGKLVANCSKDNRQPLFDMPDAGRQTYRGGVGNMTFGLAYAFFNQAKDDTKPTWIVGLDYEAPTAELLDPSIPATNPDTRGPIGDRVHKYKLYTSISRRMGAADPYFQVHYTFPYRGPGWYSNCDDPGPTNMGHPENCSAPGPNGQRAWTREETGVLPPHVGGIIIGSEFNAYDEPSRHQKVAIDLRGIATYVSPSRTMNEMSDLFAKLMYTQDYLELGGRLAMHFHAAEYVHLSLYTSLLYRTEHTVTDERIGKDLDGDGEVEVGANNAELNPNFDFRVDMVSRRFRSAENSVLQLGAVASFNF